jgi:carboxyl-terminal processing protease
MQQWIELQISIARELLCKARFLLYFCLCVTLVSCGGGGKEGEPPKNNFISGGVKPSLPTAPSKSSVATSSRGNSISSERTSVGSSSSQQSEGTAEGWAKDVYLPRETFESLCEVPRQGVPSVFGGNYWDDQGTRMDEKMFIRSWINETYLWYREVQDINPQTMLTVEDYFLTQKTTAKTSSGKDKDQFHYYYKTSDYESLAYNTGEHGYGFNFIFVERYVPRNLKIAYVEDGSPAAKEGVSRGDRILKVNNLDLVGTNDAAKIDAINQALFEPQESDVVSLMMRRADGVEYTVILTAELVVSTLVQNVKVINHSDKKIGYFAFHSHMFDAESLLIDAFSQFKTQAVDELVIDLRYNPGGLLDMASQVAYMVAGEANTKGKTFGQLSFNDKHPEFDPITGEKIEKLGFRSYSLNATQKLPSLTLNRVVILSGNDTCSASEALINGLRGIDIDVILIGETTCGKPYGFYSQENCGNTYFSVQFMSVNAKGFGGYQDGFSPAAIDNNRTAIRGCVVPDDLAYSLGDEREARLATALAYLETGECNSMNTGGHSGLSINDTGINTRGELLQRKSFGDALKLR